MRPSAPRRSLRSNAGFSLLEILLVGAMTAALLGVAGLALSRYVEELRFRDAVQVLTANLGLARDAAVQDSQTVRIRLEGNVLAWSSTDDGLVIDRVELPGGAAAAAPAEVLVSGRGLPLVQTTFRISDGERTRDVVLLPTGAILR